MGAVPKKQINDLAHTRGHLAGVKRGRTGTGRLYRALVRGQQPLGVGCILRVSLVDLHRLLYSDHENDQLLKPSSVLVGLKYLCSGYPFTARRIRTR